MEFGEGKEASGLCSREGGGGEPLLHDTISGDGEGAGEAIKGAQCSGSFPGCLWLPG